MNSERELQSVFHRGAVGYSVVEDMIRGYSWGFRASQLYI